MDFRIILIRLLIAVQWIVMEDAHTNKWLSNHLHITILTIAYWNSNSIRFTRINMIASEERHHLKDIPQSRSSHNHNLFKYFNKEMIGTPRKKASWMTQWSMKTMLQLMTSRLEVFNHFHLSLLLLTLQRAMKIIIWRAILKHSNIRILALELELSEGLKIL